MSFLIHLRDIRTEDLKHASAQSPGKNKKFFYAEQLAQNQKQTDKYERTGKKTRQNKTGFYRAIA